MPGPRLRHKVPERRRSRRWVGRGWIVTDAALFCEDREALLSEPRDRIGEGERRRRRRRRRRGLLASFASLASLSSTLLDRAVQPPGRERGGCPRSELHGQFKRRGGRNRGRGRRNKHRGLPGRQRRERVALLEHVKGGDGGGGGG